MFEALVKTSSKVLKKEILESQLIMRIPSSLLISHSEFDVSFYRSNFKFLPFRNFQPFRTEAICLISIIFWNKEKLPQIFTELVNELIKCKSFISEVENLKQKDNKLRKITAMSFFSRLIKSEDKKILYLMRQQKIFQAIQRELEETPKLRLLFKQTAIIIESMDSIF